MRRNLATDYVSWRIYGFVLDFGFVAAFLASEIKSVRVVKAFPTLSILKTMMVSVEQLIVSSMFMCLLAREL